jgi:hypothetical protein
MPAGLWLVTASMERDQGNGPMSEKHWLLKRFEAHRTI